MVEGWGAASPAIRSLRSPPQNTFSPTRSSTRPLSPPCCHASSPSTRWGLKKTKAQLAVISLWMRAHQFVSFPPFPCPLLRRCSAVSEPFTVAFLLRPCLSPGLHELGRWPHYTNLNVKRMLCHRREQGRGFSCVQLRPNRMRLHGAGKLAGATLGPLWGKPKGLPNAHTHASSCPRAHTHAPCEGEWAGRGGEARCALLALPSPRPSGTLPGLYSPLPRLRTGRWPGAWTRRRPASSWLP